MAVAYIPAYIEDQSNFFKERANGLYGSTAFLVANFLIGIPYLFLITIVFSVITYWLVGLHSDAATFFRFVGFLLLDLLAAESLVVFIASALPNFIVALAVSAFANGLWMCTNGFLVPETTLNVFWRSWVTKIDYQNWVFRALMVNEFENATFRCSADGNCAYPSPGNGVIPGSAILESYGYASSSYGAWAGYMLAIIVTYRLLAFAALQIRQRA
jgi:ABC-type multidrug transport system permease subunit